MIWIAFFLAEKKRRNAHPRICKKKRKNNGQLFPILFYLVKKSENIFITL